MRFSGGAAPHCADALADGRGIDHGRLHNHNDRMALTNAERQVRWRERNQVVLTESAADIAAKLMEMSDQGKLRRIAAFLNDHLRHPDRSPAERAVALGKTGINRLLHGPLGKRAALEHLRKPAPDHSWLVEAATADGRRWRNGARFGTREEAEAYVTAHVSHDLKTAGYVSACVLRCDDVPNCVIYRHRKGGRLRLGIPEGACVWLGWRSVP
jgi:hypothetical protein